MCDSKMQADGNIPICDCVMSKCNCQCFFFFPDLYWREKSLQITHHLCHKESVDDLIRDCVMNHFY